MKERAPSVIQAGKAGLRDRMCSYVSALRTSEARSWLNSSSCCLINLWPVATARVDEKDVLKLKTASALQHR